MTDHLNDYYYQQRLKYKDDERLLKYIELSKILDGANLGDTPCYDPKTMMFTIYVSTNDSFQGRSDFNGFEFKFFPDLGNSWNYDAKNFFGWIFEGCVREGLKQKSRRVYSLIDGL